jgi:hypothetical protein
LNPKNPFGKWLIKTVDPLIPRAAQAAMPIIHAACANDAGGGDYYGPTGFLEIRGGPGKARVNPIAKDIDVGKGLWALSESMTGIRYLSEPPWR